MWPGLHDIHDSRLWIGIPALPAYDTENNVSVVHHDADILIRPAAALDILQTFPERTGRDILMQHLFDPWFLCLCALGFPTDSQPIGFPGCVSIDFLEAHSFEPPGSPGAEIALEILAVHDHCLVLSKGSRGFRIHDFKRNIDRLRQVLLLVGRRR